MKQQEQARAVFLDRDGTIARYRVYCRSPQEFDLLPGAGNAIRSLNRAGFLVMVMTNQSAISRGMITRQTLEAIHQKMHRELAKYGARVDAVYFCPHHPDDGCACRKPQIGMITQAVQEWNLSLKRSYAVGDRHLDVQTGQAAGATAILVRSGHPPEPADGIVPAHEADSLEQAAVWILSREQRPRRRAKPPVKKRRVKSSVKKRRRVPAQSPRTTRRRAKPATKRRRR